MQATKFKKPYWPKTTIFWGAGATAELGIPTTAQMATALHELADNENSKSLQERIKNANVFHGIEEELEHFLTALGDEPKENSINPNKKAIEAAKKIQPDNFTEDNVIEKILQWKTHYDWNALRRLAIKTPYEEDDSYKYITDLYNIIDGSLLNNQGIETFVENENVFLGPHRLRNARNLLVLFTNLMIICAYHKIRKTPEKFEPYSAFAKALGKLMQQEAIDYQGPKYSDKEFYLMSFAIISMNFDSTLLWFMFMANDELNKNPPHLGKRNLPVKLFLDFSVFAAFKNLDRDIMYSLDETGAWRTNKDEEGGRLYRICKYFLPHGGTNFRECENCGKMLIAYGKWKNTPDDLFLPPPFKIKLFQHEPYKESEKEKDAHKKGDYDAVECSFCGSLTYTYNTPMIMQTSYKSGHKGVLEEIQRDTKVSLSGTKHVVLMGYQLPSDDIVWRSAIVAKHNNEKIRCSVVVGSEGEQRWIYGEELIEYVKKNKSKPDKADYGINAIEAAIAIFGKDNVRAYTGGIPFVWLSGGSVDKDKVEDLINPKLWR